MLVPFRAINAILPKSPCQRSIRRNHQRSREYLTKKNRPPPHLGVTGSEDQANYPKLEHNRVRQAPFLNRLHADTRPCLAIGFNGDRNQTVFLHRIADVQLDFPV